MRRTNKKAFTLIELLAVIVILAIIALIAVPVVMNIINKANKSAFKDSAYGIIKAGELYYTDQLLEQDGTVEEKTFTFPNDTVGLEINGSKPTGGTMTVNKDGKISLAITNGKYCVTKGFEDEDVQISDDIINCQVAAPGSLSSLAITHTFNATSTSTTQGPDLVEIPTCITAKTKCAAGTPVAVEVAPEVIYKFYVLNDDTTKNEVTLIMNRNLYSVGDANNGNVAGISLGDYKIAGGTEADYGTYGKNDKGPLTALKTLKTRTSGWTNIPAYTYTLENDYDGQGGSNTYSPISKPSTATSEIIVENVRARLPRYSELTSTELGCTTVSRSCKSWLYENLDGTGDNNSVGYWTSTTSSVYSSAIWAVNNYSAVTTTSSNYGCLSQMSVFIADLFGIRPVITLSK